MTIPSLWKLAAFVALSGAVLLPGAGALAQDCPASVPGYPRKVGGEAFDFVTCQRTGNIDRWTLERPDVKDARSEYRFIRFAPGDRVTVSAEGCVQTGGHGQTWKRYVNPSGPNSDHLYHGQIQIPGATGNGIDGGMQLVERYIAAGPITVTRATDLFLGYQDDGYGDNGYYSHDDGTENQCRGVGPVRLQLVITHVPTPPPPPALHPFDLADGPLDLNLFPFNPKWAWQVTHNALPDTLTQCQGLGTSDMLSCSTLLHDYDTPGTFNGIVACKGKGPNGFNGHANFVPVSYEGYLSFIDHKDWTQKGDDDYSLRFVPLNGGGLTQENTDAFEVEYDSDDSVDWFHSPWWDEFHSAVDSGQADSKLPPGSYSIITGLLGFDCGEACYTELHPVYAIATRVKDDPSDETWSIFVRNYGDEGGCGQNQHPVEIGTYTFSLPWRKGATGVTPTGLSYFETNTQDSQAPEVAPVQNDSVRVTFHLQGSGDQRFVNGALHLQWSGAVGPVAPVPAHLAPLMARRTGPEQEATRHQSLLRTAISQLPPAKQAELKAGFKAAVAAPATHRLPPPRLVAAAPRPAEVAAAPQQSVAVAAKARIVAQSVPDPRRQQRLTKIHDLLCAEFHNQVPGAPARYCGNIRIRPGGAEPGDEAPEPGPRNRLPPRGKVLPE